MKNNLFILLCVFFYLFIFLILVAHSAYYGFSRDGDFNSYNKNGDTSNTNISISQTACSVLSKFNRHHLNLIE